MADPGLSTNYAPAGLSSRRSTEHLLPRWAGRDILPPPCHVPPGGEQLRLVRGANDVVGTGEVAKIRERELVPGQEPALRQPPLVHAEHLSQLRFVLSDDRGSCFNLMLGGNTSWKKILAQTLLLLLHWRDEDGSSDHCILSIRLVDVHLP
ncbi:hypothetical protein BHM03_00055617 [Ensete ventricosum]|nr:hypothetical protein BHM03_00055617 [Ensete ventricosum]